jgi:hypothetical protein
MLARSIIFGLCATLKKYGSDDDPVGGTNSAVNCLHVILDHATARVVAAAAVLARPEVQCVEIEDRQVRTLLFRAPYCLLEQNLCVASLPRAAIERNNVHPVLRAVSAYAPAGTPLDLAAKYPQKHALSSVIMKRLLAVEIAARFCYL